MTKRPKLTTPTWTEKTPTPATPDPVAQVEPTTEKETKHDDRRVLTLRIDPGLYERLTMLIATRRIKRLPNRTMNDALTEAIEAYLTTHGV